MFLSRRVLTYRRSDLIASSSRFLSTFSTKAAVCTELGKPLEYLDWTIGSPTKNQVKIEVVSAGINFADVLQVQGLYQEKMTPPFVSGMECAGVLHHRLSLAAPSCITTAEIDTCTLCSNMHRILAHKHDSPFWG